MSDYDLYCSSWEMGVHLFFVNESLNHFHELQRNIISGRYSPGNIKKHQCKVVAVSGLKKHALAVFV